MGYYMAGGAAPALMGHGVGTDAQGNVTEEDWGYGYRRRRMNVLNPRALRRSMRRVQGFAKFARKTISFTSRVKMKKRGRR